MATRIAKATPVKVSHWVVCDDYAAGPYDGATAERIRGKYDNNSGCPHADHRVVISPVAPVTAVEATRLYRDWNEPFFWDDADFDAAMQRRAAQAVEVAEAILAQRTTTRIDGMTVIAGGWSRETADKTNAVAMAGTPEWWTALGPHEHATLTSDARSANRQQWCECPERDNADGWARYEYWTGKGMEAHGYVCGTCRKLTQTG